MSVDLIALNAEIVNDPQGLGYATASDAVAAAILNEARASIQLHRQSIPMGEVYGQVEWPDWRALPDLSRAAFRQITSTPTLDVRSPRIRNALTAVFGAGSQTITNLQTILTRDGSRAEELFGLGVRVTPSQVADARRS